MKGVLWQAFESEEQAVVLVDEIDKADIEFPNDLLRELDRMEFYVYETRETIRARHRPVIFITSNNEKELPDAFLRRCFFHYIRFPDKETMQAIVDVHFPGVKKRLLQAALEVFFGIREMPGLKKKPSTSELLDWLKLLLAEDIPPEALRTAGAPGRHPAALRSAAEERAGRAPLRAARLPAAARGIACQRARRSGRCAGRRSAKGEKRLAGVGTGAVLRATGRPWDEWLKVLDRAGAERLPHKRHRAAALAQVRRARLVVPDGDRRVRAGAGAAQRRASAPTASPSTPRAPSRRGRALYDAWSDAATRERWLLDAPVEVRAPPRQVDAPRVDAERDRASTSHSPPRAAARDQVAVAHAKLANARRRRRRRRTGTRRSRG